MAIKRLFLLCKYLPLYTSAKSIFIIFEPNRKFLQNHNQAFYGFRTLRTVCIMLLLGASIPTEASQSYQHWPAEHWQASEQQNDGSNLTPNRAIIT